MKKSRAQIIDFENNRKINKSIVFVSLLIHDVHNGGRVQGSVNDALI